MWWTDEFGQKSLYSWYKATYIYISFKQWWWLSLMQYSGYCVNVLKNVSPHGYFIPDSKIYCQTDSCFFIKPPYSLCLYTLQKLTFPALMTPPLSCLIPVWCLSLFHESFLKLFFSNIVPCYLWMSSPIVDKSEIWNDRERWGLRREVVQAVMIVEGERRIRYWTGWICGLTDTVAGKLKP